MFYQGIAILFRILLKILSITFAFHKAVLVSHKFLAKESKSTVHRTYPKYYYVKYIERNKKLELSK